MSLEAADRGWRGLYRVAAWAAVLSAVFVPIQVAVFFVKPLPETVLEWFALFQDNVLVGLIDLDLLLVADNVLLIAIMLALYVALRRVSPSVAVLALAAGLAGIVLFVSSNTAFEMLSLSDKHAAAASGVERALYVAAGEMALATWQGSAFKVAYLLGSFAGIAISALMLPSSAFGRWPGWLGILANVVGLALFVPVVGIYIAVFSVLFLWVWYMLLARAFFRLGRRGAQTT